MPSRLLALLAVPLWIFSPGPGTLDNPVVDDGRVFVTLGADHLYALDIATGKPLWNRPLDLAGRPILTANGRLYFQAADHTVHALEAATGRDLWHSAPVTTLLAADESELYMLAPDQILATLHANTGQPARRTTIQGDALTRVQIKGGRAWLTNQRLQVLDRQTLKPVWRATQEAQPGSSVGLLVGKERAYLHDGKAIHALDSVSGRHLWTYATPSPAQAEDQGVLYFTQNTDVHLLDAATGTLRSRMPAKDLRLYPFGSLTVSEGLIYAVATRPHNFLSGFSGTADTALCAKEPSTGKNAWCTDWRYEYLNAPVLAGNLLFAGTTGEAGRPATLYAIKTK